MKYRSRSNMDYCIQEVILRCMHVPSITAVGPKKRQNILFWAWFMTTRKVFFFFRKKNLKSSTPPVHTLPTPNQPASGVIPVNNTLSRPVLHFYQVSSKYCVGYLSYRVDTESKSNTRRGDNSRSKKARVVILVHNTSSCPVHHFCQVKLK